MTEKPHNKMSYLEFAIAFKKFQDKKLSIQERHLLEELIEKWRNENERQND